MQDTYKGPIDLIRKVYSKHGIAGIYKGQAITILRELHGYGIYFSLYEYLIQQNTKRNNITRDKISPFSQLLYGAISGYVLWIFIYPIDVIKSKIQTDSFIASEKKFKGSWDCLVKTFQVQGVKGLYKVFLVMSLNLPFNTYIQHLVLILIKLWVFKILVLKTQEQ